MGKQHGLYVVDVGDGEWAPVFLTTTVRPATALGGEEGLTGLPLRSRAQHLVCNSPGSACTGGNDSQLSMGIPWTHRRWRRVPEKKGWHVLTHDPMPKWSATPRIALMNNNREAERALRMVYREFLASNRGHARRICATSLGCPPPMHMFMYQPSV